MNAPMDHRALDASLHAAVAPGGTCSCIDCEERRGRADRREDRVVVAFIVLALLYFGIRGLWS